MVTWQYISGWKISRTVYASHKIIFNQTASLFNPGQTILLFICVVKPRIVDWWRGAILSKGIEVDKAKVDLISNLPPPKTIRKVRSFLGHAGFYRRFIKDFNKVSRPLYNLLVKDVPFVFDDSCLVAFEKWKHLLTSSPIIQPPNWSLPFELMCDASDYAVGAVLGPVSYTHLTLPTN